jgi:hypothetical protein
VIFLCISRQQSPGERTSTTNSGITFVSPGVSVPLGNRLSPTDSIFPILLAKVIRQRDDEVKSEARRGRFVYFLSAAVFTLEAAPAFDFSLSNSSSIWTNVLRGLNFLPANAGWSKAYRVARKRVLPAFGRAPRPAAELI